PPILPCARPTNATRTRSRCAMLQRGSFRLPRRHSFDEPAPLETLVLLDLEALRPDLVRRTTGHVVTVDTGRDDLDKPLDPVDDPRCTADVIDQEQSPARVQDALHLGHGLIDVGNVAQR